MHSKQRSAKGFYSFFRGKFLINLLSNVQFKPFDFLLICILHYAENSGSVVNAANNKFN